MDDDIILHIPPQRTLYFVLVPPDQYEALLAVVEAARAVHDGASTEVRRVAIVRLGAALESYDAAVRRTA